MPLPALAAGRLSSSLAALSARRPRGPGRDPFQYRAMIDAAWLALRAAGFILVLQASGGGALFLALFAAPAGAAPAAVLCG